MTIRKHIRPADPRATIPDPARGRDLPPDGLPCVWSVHWARLHARGDVIVTEIPEADPAPPAEDEGGTGEPPPAEGEPAPPAGPAPEEAPEVPSEPDPHPDA